MEKESLSLPDLHKKFADTYAAVSNLSLVCGKLERSLQSLSDTVAENISKSLFAEHQEEVHSLIFSLRKEFGEFLTFRTSLADLLDAVGCRAQKVQNEVQLQEKKSLLLEKELERLKLALANAINDLNDNMHLNVKKVKEEVCKKIDSLSIPTDFVTIQQLRNEVSSRIEAPCLDARNALLTARNHELRLGILERKVENALLQLKNKELGDE